MDSASLPKPTAATPHCEPLLLSNEPVLTLTFEESVYLHFQEGFSETTKTSLPKPRTLLQGHALPCHTRLTSLTSHPGAAASLQAALPCPAESQFSFSSLSLARAPHPDPLRQQGVRALSHCG